MYSRNSNLGKNIWDDGNLHIPPGYRGNAFRSPVSRDTQLRDEGKIHPPEQKLYTGGRQYTSQSHPGVWQSQETESIREDGIYSHSYESADEYGSEFEISEEIPKEITVPQEDENTGRSDDIPVKDEKSSLHPVPNVHLDTLFTDFLSSLGREEWLLILVFLLLWADGSEAWDVMLFLLFLLGVH